MWSETVGLTTRPVPKNRSWYVLQVWCCETRSNCYARRPNDLDSWRTQQLFKYYLYSFSILCFGTSLWWRSTVAFTYLKVKSAKCVRLLPVVLVLVLRILSCLHHCYITYGYRFPIPWECRNPANCVALRTRLGCDFSRRYHDENDVDRRQHRVRAPQQPQQTFEGVGGNCRAVLDLKLADDAGTLPWSCDDSLRL